MHGNIEIRGESTPYKPMIELLSFLSRYIIKNLKQYLLSLITKLSKNHYQNIKTTIWNCQKHKKISTVIDFKTNTKPKYWYESTFWSLSLVKIVKPKLFHSKMPLAANPTSSNPEIWKHGLNHGYNKLKSIITSSC